MDSVASRLRPSIAQGLYNLSCSPKSSIRNRVAEEGAVDVFVRLGCSDAETDATRRLCMLGLVNLLWAADADQRRAILSAGAVKVFAIAARRPSAQDRLAAATALHFASCFRSDVTPLLHDGGISALAGILARFARSGVALSRSMPSNHSADVTEA